MVEADLSLHNFLLAIWSQTESKYSHDFPMSNTQQEVSETFYRFFILRVVVK